MALTRSQIIAEALSQIGRTDLTSNARLWLNLFLEKVYKTQDWAWLVKDGGTLSLTDGGSVPSDYWKLKGGNVFNSNGDYVGQVRQVTADEWIQLKQSKATSSGTPIYLYVDEDARTFNLWPTPDTTYTWNPFYYYLPTLPTHSDNTGDAATPKWGLNDEVLIRAVQLKALYYNDDQRYKDEEQILITELVQAKMNSGDFKAGSHKLKLGKSFRNRF